jgi:hypothetical protein
MGDIRGSDFFSACGTPDWFACVDITSDGYNEVPFITIGSTTEIGTLIPDSTCYGTYGTVKQYRFSLLPEHSVAIKRAILPSMSKHNSDLSLREKTAIYNATMRSFNPPSMVAVDIPEVVLHRAATITTTGETMLVMAAGKGALDTLFTTWIDKPRSWKLHNLERLDTFLNDVLHRFGTHSPSIVMPDIKPANIVYVLSEDGEDATYRLVDTDEIRRTGDGDANIASISIGVPAPISDRFAKRQIDEWQLRTTIFATAGTFFVSLFTAFQYCTEGDIAALFFHGDAITDQHDRRYSPATYEDFIYRKYKRVKPVLKAVIRWTGKTPKQKKWNRWAFTAMYALKNKSYTYDTLLSSTGIGAARAKLLITRGPSTPRLCLPP